MNKYQQYDEYLTEHIFNVKQAYYWIIKNLPAYDFDTALDIIQNHDISKYSEEEFTPYAEYFYGDRTEHVKIDFDHAWNHHQKTNPHHWQYWVLIKDTGEFKCLDMPCEYMLEMVCDWWAFSWKQNNLYEIFDWYEKNKSHIMLSDTTRKMTETLLGRIKNTLSDRIGVD